MTFNLNQHGHAKKVATLIADTKGGDKGLWSGLWRWINGVAHGVAHFIGGPVTNAIKVIRHHLQSIVDTLTDIGTTFVHITFWFDFLVWHVVRGWIAKLSQRTDGQLAALKRYLVGLIFVTTQTVLTLAMRAVRAERHDRQVAVGRAEAQAKALIRALHGTIEREAASGYRVDREQRTSVVVRLLEFAAVRNPELRAVTGDIARGLIDLLAVDDPLVRIALGFLINHVIDHLGIDKAVGALIGDLAGPLLARNDPRDIHDVVMDLSERLDTDEAQWAKFMADGGAQVEQAGSNWRDLTSLATSAAIVAFTVQAVAEPDQWARDIFNLIGEPANDLAERAGRLFRGL